MKQLHCSVVGIVLVMPCIACGITTNNFSNQVSIPLTTVGASVFRRADVAFAKTLVNRTHLKGSAGESWANRSFLKEVLKEGDGWHSVTPRIGRQGLDHIYLKTDAKGMPRGLVVGESKYGSSVLGLTKDGVQMGNAWRNKRLVAIGTRYAYIADSAIKCERMPLLAKHKLNVTIGGKDVFFWRNSSLDSWKFSGDLSELPKAQKMAKVYAKHFTAAGRNVISYKARIFLIKPQGNDVVVSILNADNLESKNLKQLTSTREVVVKGGMSRKITKDAVLDLAGDLKGKMNLAESEALEYANKIAKDTNARIILNNKFSYLKDSLKYSGKTSLVAAAIDVTIQCITTCEVDARKVLVSAGVSGGTVATASGLQYLALRQSKSLTPILSKAGMSVSKATLQRGIGTAIGFGGAFLYDVALYFIEDQSAGELGQNLSITAASSLAGLGASAGALGLATAIGTASTGTAISSLSGAAASKAALAWLGGGAVSAGGGGTVVGMAVVGGVAAVAAVAVGGGIYYVIYRYNLYKKMLDTEKMYAFYERENTLRRAVEVYNAPIN